ncbi:Rid family detoxifying hydrolase [Mesoplasma photuris]|uniref:Rid family detoxifying hydrolase n=1 Tax=Mesoplasma photuris TaxID=217731 RepID=UPI0004E22FAB|nr:Rid family detoxifying hydrolase [Mesoplasma photuris]
MKNKVIIAKDAPKAVGPYSAGVVTVQGILYISGQLPIDPKTGEMVEKNAKAQTLQSLKNVEAILRANDMTLQNIVKTTVFLADIKDFADMNEVYAEFLGDVKPARSAFQVAALPKEAIVEIEVIAA